MIKKLKFDCLWFEWAIVFTCKCGELIETTDTSPNPIECESCERKYKFDVYKQMLIEVKKK